MHVVCPTGDDGPVLELARQASDVPLARAQAPEQLLVRPVPGRALDALGLQAAQRPVRLLAQGRHGAGQRGGQRGRGLLLAGLDAGLKEGAERVHLGGEVR